MKSTYLILLFLLYSILGVSQGVTVVKTDNTQFPIIKVYIKAGGDSVKKSDFQLFELNKSVDFKFDTLPASDLAASKAILFMAQQELFQRDSMSLNLLSETFSRLKEFDKMNTCFFSGEDTIGSCLGVLSPEFSTDFNFFRNRFEDLAFVKNDEKTKKDDDDFFSRLFYTLNFMKTRALLSATKAIFIFSEKINYLGKENLASCIKLAKKNRISIYVADIGKNDSPVSNHFIKLCTKTGGIYTRINSSDIPKTVAKYFEDVNAGIQLPASESYTLTFKAEQSQKVNYFEIEKDKKKLRTFYTKKNVLDNFTIREYFFAAGALLILMVFLTMNFFAWRKKNKNKALKTAPKPSHKEFALVAASEPVLIVNTRGKIKSYKITKPEINIGRRTDNSIVITDATVSAYHAQIFYYSGKFYIKDLDSTNGVFINNNKEKTCELKNNDKIKVGISLITIRFSL